MQCLVKARPAFAHVPLSYLALPGAENAGTFNLDAQAVDTQPGSACTTLHTSAPLTALKQALFSTTQDETIVRQLNQGIRWVDLRVGYNGGGSPVSSWRVTQNLYSSWPLSEYLDEVANWAALHPKEAVVVDLSTICYDHDPSVTVEKGLWANFDTPSTEGAGPSTIADMAADPSSFGASLAGATLSQLGHAHHNVVVVIPATAKYSQVLSNEYHVKPVRSVPPGGVSHKANVIEHSDPSIAPTAIPEFSVANAGLTSFPTAGVPALGKLQGKGMYVSKLAYELGGASEKVQDAVTSSFVGLIASRGIFQGWMSGLWYGAYSQTLATWGTRSNVVLGDGVEHGGFLSAVIERNGR